MRETFELLAKLDLEKLKKLEDPESSPEIQAFLQQLKKDYAMYIFANYDPMKQADNWLKQVSDFAASNPSDVSKNNLHKINTIFELYGGMGEDAFRLLDMYQSMDTIRKEIQVKTTVEEYKAHLEQKIQKENIVLPTNIHDTSNELSPKQQKLVNRYQAISKLREQIKDKPLLEETDRLAAKEALTTCLDNKPEWSERPLLQKLTDVLSFGFKALYRALFSKESALEEKIDRDLSDMGPTPGG